MTSSKANSKQKNKMFTLEPLDFDKCQKMEHVQPLPKSRASSITSIESEGSIQSVLSPPPRRDFDDLRLFETFIRDETWDNDYDYCHAHLTYYPPFVLKQVHNNLEKIKPTMNKNSRKFRRQLQHHVKKHLMTEMEKCSGFKMDFSKVGMMENFGSVVWKYEDTSDHGLPKEEEDLYNRHWKLELEVRCNNENPMVEVDYRSIPILV